MENLQPEIDVQTLAELKHTGSDHVVLDVREAEEIDICALPDSMQIPMRQIHFRLDDLPQDRPLIVLWHHGVRSKQVADFLREKGFTNVCNLAGGIDAWAHQVDTNTPTY